MLGVALVVFFAATASDAEAPAPRALDAPLLSPDRLPGLGDHVAARTGLERELRPDVAAAGFGDSCVAVGSPGGNRLFSAGGEDGRIPASTLKLVTGASALRVLGPDTVFRTKAYLRDGTLYVRGGGDPVLATPQWITDNPDRLATPLQKLADAVKASGRPVQAIVVDPSALDAAPRVDGWESRYASQGNAPGIGAFTVDRPTGTDPAVAGGRALAGLLGVPEAPVSVGSVPDGATEVAELVSPPVKDIVGELNTFSDNLVGEVLIRHLGATRKDPTTEGGTKVEVALLDELGVDTADIVIIDGSGLHRGNRVSCAAFLALLSAVAEDPRTAEAFTGSLASPGEPGSLRKRSRLPSSVDAKTGTLNDVSSLVGWVDTPAGRVPFAIVQNGTSGDTQSVQDAIVRDIAGYGAQKAGGADGVGKRGDAGTDG